MLKLFVLATVILVLGSPRVWADEATQEMDAEAQKLRAQYFTTCGEDAFTKETMRGGQGAYMIHQYKELTVTTESTPLSQTDRLNGLAWKGVIRFTATAERVFPHGKAFKDVRDILPSADAPDVWSPWKEMSIFAVQVVPAEKRQGQVLLDQHLAKQLAATPCAAIPR